LTPERKPAEEREFIALSVDELIQVIKKSVDLSDDCTCKTSINTFLDCYYWIN
jgi:hypothetical protein